MYESIWKAAANYLSAERMMLDIMEFFEESRWSSFDKMRALAHRIAAKMKDAGLVDVRLIQLPADGRTSYGGWVLPKAYDVAEARLTEIVDGESREVFADYKINPTSLMMYSHATPPGGITAELVIADRLEDFTSNGLSGRLALTAGLGIGYSQAAVRAGAVGIVSDCRAERAFMKEGAYLDETNEWHNYTIPPWEALNTRTFGFAITPKQGRYLRGKIEAGDKVRLHALVRTHHYDGILPVISGRLAGKSAEEIAITGHYDEFGADDNCSQVAVALEAARAIRAMVDAGEVPPLKRTIRLLFPMEVRGFNALIQNDEEIRNLRSGLNIDTVGTDQNAVTAICTLTSNFLALPSLVDDFAGELLERIRKENPLFRWRLSNAEIIDNIFGEPLIGAPTPSIYHFSGTHHVALDTPERISGRMLRDMARLTATYAAFLANAGLEEAVWLADLSAQRGVQRIQELASASLRGTSGGSKLSLLLQRLGSLQALYDQKVTSASWMVPRKQIFPSAKHIGKEADVGSPSQALCRDTSCCVSMQRGNKGASAPAARDSELVGPMRLLPQEEYLRRAEEFQVWIDRSAEEAEAVIRRRSGDYHDAKRKLLSTGHTTGTSSSDAAIPVSRCVPVKTFRGFLSFEDLNPEEEQYLTNELGIRIGWGAPMWLQEALMFANGERTAAEIAELLRCHGAGGPDVPILERTFAFLAERGLARLRKYVTLAEVKDALAEAGLVAGDAILGHFSLSEFGYLEGGAEGLIHTLVDLLGPSGTLMMPTFTFSFMGNAPYDPTRSASREGTVSDYFWRRSGVLRSAHPSHSFAAVGKSASYLLEGHDHTRSPVSKDGPIGKLADLDGKILMFCGVSGTAEGENRGSQEMRGRVEPTRPVAPAALPCSVAYPITLCPALGICMHAGEYWAGIPFHDFACHIWEGEVPREVREVVVPDCPWHGLFDRAYEKLHAQGLVRDVSLGESAIHTVRCRDAIEAQAEVARSDPESLIKPGCHCPYCQRLRQYCQKRRENRLP